MLAVVLAWFCPLQLEASECGQPGVVLQVLGSGGPELTKGRASSSYLVRSDGLPRVLVDIGGGAAANFGDSGAMVDELDMILLTHLHVDHSGDLPALVKSSYFGSRSRALPVLGPAGGGQFPSTSEFVQRLFGPAGAFAYLADYLPADGKAVEGAYALQPRDITPGPGELLEVHADRHLKVSAVALQHGSVPAVGWRLELDGVSLAFSGDTNGNNGALEVLAQDVDLLVAHNAVPEGATGAARALHMPPSVIGRIAHEAKVGKLLLSHRMNRTLGREAETRREIARTYHGETLFADDLDCFRVGRSD